MQNIESAPTKKGIKLMSLKKYTSLLFFAVMCGLATPSQALFLTNADFEVVNIAPPYPTPLPYVSASLADVPGWTHVGSAGDAALLRVGYFDAFGSVTTAGSGMQFVIMGGGHPDLGGAIGAASWEQDITGLIPGARYLLEFMMAAEGVVGSPIFTLAGSTQMIVVEIPQISLFKTFTATNTVGNYWQDWENKSLSFTAGNTAHTLKYSYTGLYDVGLDHVRITQVPEPASLGLLAIGLAVLAVVRRRSRKME